MRIDARRISATIGGRTILSGIDLAVEPGKLMGLVGPNGAGKSTLLRVLAGLIPPQAGELLYDGRPAAVLSARERARRIAFLTQASRLDWPLTAARLVSLGRLPHRGLLGPLDPDRDEAAIREAMAATDTLQFADRPVSTLSGGERMRVMLARALAVEASTFLADEPVTALDPAHQLQTMQILRDIAGRGTGVVVVLHDLTLAARFCDSVALIAQGRLAALGAPQEVLTAAMLRSVYGISPYITENEGELVIIPWR